jgi:hypothetical protein
VGKQRRQVNTQGMVFALRRKSGLDNRGSNETHNERASGQSLQGAVFSLSRNSTPRRQSAETTESGAVAGFTRNELALLNYLANTGNGADRFFPNALSRASVWATSRPGNSR